MNKSLRDDVEALLSKLRVESGSSSSDFATDCCGATEGHAIAKCAVEIQSILARHPAADGVVVDADIANLRASEPKPISLDDDEFDGMDDHIIDPEMGAH